MTTQTNVTPVFELLDQDLAKSCAAALTRYRSGDDEVKVEFGELSIKLFDRKDNADRETVRMTMEEFLNCIRMCHINGAAMASSTLTHIVAQMSGLNVSDDDDDDDHQVTDDIDSRNES